MKLIVQVPCYNEEKTLPLVINSIPKKIKGISSIETMVIDDGSTDRTVKIAKSLGVNHIIKNTRNKGLARTFASGLINALSLGADIIVNTDGDNQYPQKDIPRLIEPILSGRADLVIANRQTAKIAHFSKTKKLLQKFGSWVVRFLSGVQVPDAVSGFRAYSREAAMKMNIVTDFSYVIETIISAQYHRLAIAAVDVKVNPPTRKSRLFKNMSQHIRHSGATIIRIYTMHQPLMVFVSVGLVFIFTGSLFALRFVYYFLTGTGSGHIQSLIFSAILIMVGFQIAMTGLVADLIRINRRLSEDSLDMIKKMYLNRESKKNRI